MTHTIVDSKSTNESLIRCVDALLKSAMVFPVEYLNHSIALADEAEGCGLESLYVYGIN